MDRKPLPPPFPVGTRLRYTGTTKSWTGQEPNLIPTQWPGMETTVTKVNLGRQGTLRMIDLDDGDEPFPDETRDGYSVWVNAAGQGRIIHCDDAKNWEVI